MNSIVALFVFCAILMFADQLDAVETINLQLDAKGKEQMEALANKPEGELLEGMKKLAETQQGQAKVPL